MAMIAGKSITKADVMKMQKRMTSLQSRAKNVAAKAEGIVEAAVATVETGAAAFGLGVVQGRYGPVDVMGVPLDLAAGIGLHGLAILGVGGEMGSHLHNFGNGALAAYLNTIGRGIGIGMAQEPEVTAGGGTDRLSDEELADL